MSEYKTIEQMDLEGKRVLVRLDLNVPIKKGVITDFTRIDASLKTIQYVIDKGGRAVLMSHLGRPEGQRNVEYSLKLVAESLSEKVGIDVAMASDCIGEETEKIVNNLEDGQAILLENLRFHPGEEENDSKFVDSLAKLGDAYVNDAFGTAHRAHASTYGVPLKLLESGKEVGAGFLMDEELQIWKPIVESKAYSVAIVGGAKLEEKMKAVKKLGKTFDRIIIGGVVANVFMKAAGYNIADSRYLEKDKDFTADAKEILAKIKVISMPTQAFVATKDLKKVGISDPKKGISAGQIFADVLPSKEDIAAIEKAGRIVWFGPMGIYEQGFTDGSLTIVAAINKSKGYCVIGGGDLAAAAEGVKAKVSTGGGASIQYITTGKLEALLALNGNTA